MNLATPILALSPDASRASTSLPMPIFMAAATPPSALERAAAVLLLAASSAPAAVLVWVVSS